MSQKSFDKNYMKDLTKIYMCCNIESSTKMNQFKYGDIKIMPILYKNDTYLRNNKFNTHSEEGVG